MKAIGSMLGFDSDAYQDHTGAPSFTRRALAILISIIGIVIFASFALIAYLSADKAKLISSHTLSLITTLSTLVGAGFAVKQGAKAHAQAAATKPPKPSSPIAKAAGG